MRDSNRVKHFYICFNGFFEMFSWNHWAKKVKIYLQGDLLQNKVVKTIIPERLGVTTKKSNLHVFIRKILAYLAQVSDAAPGPPVFWQDLSVDTKEVDLVTLTLVFDLLIKNFNLGYIF
jgi:hypothetical protein